MRNITSTMDEKLATFSSKDHCTRAGGKLESIVKIIH